MSKDFNKDEVARHEANVSMLKEMYWTQDRVKKCFDELGFIFPETEEQLQALNEKFKDYPFKSDETKIDPIKILKSIKMSELKTPYLDKEIKEFKEWIGLDPDATKKDKARLKEYSSIKEVLSDLQATKKELEDEKFRHNNTKALEDGARRLLKKAEAELEEVTKNLEKSLISERFLRKEKAELYNKYEEVKSERDELRELAMELIKADGKSYVGAFNNLAENLGLKDKMI